MITATSTILVRPLQQLGQTLNASRILHSFDDQIDVCIGNNKVLIRQFEARAKALETAGLTSSSYSELDSCNCFIHYCDELNKKLKGLKSEITEQDADVSLEMLELDLWPVVVKLTALHAKKIGGPCYLINDGLELIDLVARYAVLINGPTAYQLDGDKLNYSAEANNMRKKKRLERAVKKFRDGCLGLLAVMCLFAVQIALQERGAVAEARSHAAEAGAGVVPLTVAAPL